MSSTISYTHPTKTLNGGKLTFDQIQQWRSEGYALVDGLISDQLAANDALKNKNNNDFGSDGILEFPSGFKACDELVIEESLINAAADLLNVNPHDLRLIQSDVWPKRGVPVVNAQSNQDQRIHCDYGNNSLLHPPSWDDPECVSMIIYLSDESVTGGGTAVVPRRGADDPSYKYPLIAMPGYGGLPFYNDKTSVEAFMKEKHPEYYEFRQDLYTREKRAKFSIGSVLLYRHDVWHRGTPLTPNAVRIVANIGFKKKDCDWVTCWNQGWARKMYYGCVENIIASSSLAQRSVLGFPLPGHKYWNEITIAACDARYSMYEGWDSSVYTKALTK